MNTPSSSYEDAPENPEIIRSTDFLYNSNRIEQISEMNYETLYNKVENGTHEGHAGAWNLFREAAINNTSFSYELLLEAHKKLSQEQVKLGHPLNEEFHGKIRGDNDFVRIGGRLCWPPDEEEFKGFIKKVSHQIDALGKNKKPSLNEVLSLAAKHHLKYEFIHPFNDGNGRTGRLIVNFTLAKYGFLELVIIFSRRNEYYQAFRNNHQDIPAMIEVFMEHYKDYSPMKI